MVPGCEQAKTIFLQALDLPAPQRQVYVDVQCGDNESLRREVNDLLKHNAQVNEEFLAAAPLSPAGRAVDANGGTPTLDSIRERPGSVIGQYKLLEQVGEGGFGVVFMAEQTQPVRRKVALKVLKPGMDTRQVVARFEAERQALAIMDHPNIARVFDGGATPSGRPFFVMELVKGTPITEFCDQNQLTPRERLELFVPVCQAVQHAHHKGIIHRDLKPSNMLVSRHDVTPVVKVIDFGVAKALGQELTDKTLFTGMAQMIGTPLYMSPEQAGMSDLDIDTRSDVYSLGVLLYELLTGTTPFRKERFGEAAYDEIRRIIREEDPPKPSTRLSESKDTLPSISAQRQTEPAKLTKLVRGELDWIVMKCLEKDRRRRYESASALAADVGRHLNGEAVEACPPSVRYRLRKLVRRNRPAVLAASLVLLTLLVGMTGTTWGMLRAEQHRQLAELKGHEALEAATAEKKAKEIAQEREAETQAVLDFVESRLFAAARPRRQAGGLGRDVSLREAIDVALPRVTESFSHQPLIEARLRMTLGISYSYLGDAKAAETQCLRARELYTAKLGPHDRATLSSMHNLANCYRALGQHTKALKLNEETFALRKAHLPPNDPDTLASMTSIANNYHSLERHPEALQLREQLLQLRKDKLGPHHRDTLATMNNVANSYGELNRHEQARDLYEETLRLQEKHLGADHPDVLRTMMNLANAYGDLNRHEDALELGRKTLALKKVRLGPDHPATLESMNNLGNSYARLRRFEEALKLRQETLDLMKAKHGAEHPMTLGSMWNLAAAFADLGRDDEALPIIDECVERAVGKDVPPALFSELLIRRARIFQKKLDAPGCRATAERWERLNRRDAYGLFTAARLRSITATVVAHSKTADAVSGAQEEADKAMGWLRKSVAAGFKHALPLMKQADFDVLRDREDFKKLIAELEESGR